MAASRCQSCRPYSGLWHWLRDSFNCSTQGNVDYCRCFSFSVPFVIPSEGLTRCMWDSRVYCINNDRFDWLTQMGAAIAVGVDIDPMAISSAKYNASLNNLAPNTLQVHVAPGDGDDPVPKDSGEFDVVAANILLNPLVQLASRIAGYCKPGGLVGVSGILLDQVDFLFQCFFQISLEWHPATWLSFREWENTQKYILYNILSFVTF